VRETFSDLLLGADAVPKADIAALAVSHNHQLNRIFHSAAPAANQQQKLARRLLNWHQ
jgi:hypothetical protein